jgi:enoyl-CoA hydratase/carnithine racemase
MPTTDFFHLEQLDGVRLLRLKSDDATNRLTQACVLTLIEVFGNVAPKAKPLIIAGSERFFSAGADLREIMALTGPDALEFSRMGQTLMNAIERFPSPVYAAISGYCMGGGLDLALACHRRIASPNAVLAHRGAALGLITGWGGTQRLPRLVGKAKALEIFVAADKVQASDAMSYGLVDAVAENPVAEALRQVQARYTRRGTESRFARRGFAGIP